MQASPFNLQLFSIICLSKIISYILSHVLHIDVKGNLFIKPSFFYFFPVQIICAKGHTKMHLSFIISHLFIQFSFFDENQGNFSHSGFFLSYQTKLLISNFYRTFFWQQQSFMYKEKMYRWGPCCSSNGPKEGWNERYVKN